MRAEMSYDEAAGSGGRSRLQELRDRLSGVTAAFAALRRLLIFTMGFFLLLRGCVLPY
jgi:hypothetical protein